MQFETFYPGCPTEEEIRKDLQEAKEGDLSGAAHLTFDIGDPPVVQASLLRLSLLGPSVTLL